MNPAVARKSRKQNVGNEGDALMRLQSSAVRCSVYREGERGQPGGWVLIERSDANEHT